MATIRKRGAKWQARVQIKGFDQVAKSFSSRADAEAWGKITESEMIRGAYIKRSDAEQTTLADALDRYEREVSASKRGATQEAMRIKAWKAHRLAKKTLAALRGADFAQYRDQRLKDAAPATVRLELAILGNMFNVARKEWGYEGLTNPIEAIRLPSVQNSRSRLFYDGEEALLLDALVPVTRGENGRVSAGCRNSWLRPLILLALETAMRRGELLSLRWENIRLTERVAHLPMTKNGTSRYVPLSTKAVEIFKSLPRALRGPVFTISANAINLGFVRAVERARLAYLESGGTDSRMLVDLHFHDLRHVAITRIAEKLPNIVELAAVSGHQDVRMLKRYYHPRAEDLARKLG
ncbi:MAG: site-specific integrase [Gammaproteobacteria bacterium]|nr:site-specific integrase [Gammaproteobacteria bacterium]MBU1602187.1 site-specific integrase [Gammaproteobacteria bacterium]MBU2434234.1 site-specific integrase [Gammaproteobacteria bacterium]MBU2448442.1 site-specific integrase [Gammaproteobacteria bacterium]